MEDMTQNLVNGAATLLIAGVLVFLAANMKSFKAWLDKRAAAAAAEAAASDATALEKMEGLIYHWAVTAYTNGEKYFQSGEGKEKMSFAISYILKRISGAGLNITLSEEIIKAIIDRVWYEKEGQFKQYQVSDADAPTQTE